MALGHYGMTDTSTAPCTDHELANENWYGSYDVVGETWGDMCDGEGFVTSAFRRRFEYRRDSLFSTPSCHYQDKSNENKFGPYFGTPGL